MRRTLWALLALGGLVLGGCDFDPPKIKSLTKEEQGRRDILPAPKG
ncbi:MAG: hypothetical protein KJ718_05255 [Nanoarchaeota archaeon]|nr:hypothetical protein [Nanoarchaeota archaeon]MBU1051933.1 hypothetical protein [Nanoarchaeota archaeon]MBU1988331.1 hypothetical protein [Nanoarchaeota archaeon]